jgi:hypothetical protein
MIIMHRILILLLLASGFLNNMYAQDTLIQHQHKKNIFTLAFYKQPGKDSMVDFIDGAYRILKINKLRSQGETENKAFLTLFPSVEYSLATGVSAAIKTSYLFAKEPANQNRSTIYSVLKYTQKKQVVAQLTTNFWSKNGQYNFNSNWSYLKFPQKDFGLGSNSSLDLFDQLDYAYIKMHQSLLKKIGPNLFFGPGVNMDYHWGITDTTSIAKPLNGFNEYGFTKNSNSTGFLLNLLYDTRVNNVSPVANSSYLNLAYRNNVSFLGSDQNWQSIILDYRKYLPFPKNSKNILAFWTYNQISFSGKPPYLDLPSTTNDPYNNFGRGYVQGRFRGDKLLFAESEYRFGITENGFIGGVVFANVQSLSAQMGQAMQGLLPGYGLGLRVKFNKHSHTNLALDYGIGQGGSRGFFMNLGEVF